MKYKACILGATGLIGSFLVEVLVEDNSCTEVICLVRRHSELIHSKVRQVVIDFDDKQCYLDHVHGDVLFSCFGTTRVKAGNEENHRRVDYYYQYLAAWAASENDVKNYVVVSSPWKNINSKNYYRKMKAELEIDVEKLPFNNISILRPNGLIGNRKQPRFGEGYIIHAFKYLAKYISFLKRHEPIRASEVARLMHFAYLKNLNLKEKTYAIERAELNNLIGELDKRPNRKISWTL